MRRLIASAALLFACAATASACEDSRQPPSEQQPIEPSPNARIWPAPRASELGPAPARRAGGASDAGAPLDASADASAPFTTRWLSDDQPPDADPAAREGGGARLSARFRWLDLPPFPRLPETNVEALSRLREGTGFDVEIELSSLGRLRFELLSDAFLLPRGSELHSRLDRLGHLLVWDDARKYTTLAAGTLRAVLNERRLDHTPLVKPKLVLHGNGNLLGMSTERVELSTSLGRLVLEDAAIASAGAAGKLLCRLLGELIALDPLSSACERSLVPLRAEVFSRASGHLLFEVTSIERDRPLDTPLAPPPEARFLPGELPATPFGLVPAAERLHELRVRALARSDRLESGAPKHGLVVLNRSDVPRYLLLDGAIAARVAARGELSINALLPGKYALATLDFLGDDPTPLRIVELPARVTIGEEADPAH